MSEAVLQKKTVERRERRWIAWAGKAEELLVPTSNCFSVLSRADVSSCDVSDSDMEYQGPQEKKRKSGDEQQRGAKKQSTQ